MTIGRIIVVGNNDKDMGSGFVLATSRSEFTHVALTADHVVRCQEVPSLRFATQAGWEIPVERVERDGDLDVAVLYLSGDVANGLAVGRAVEGESWQVEAQPRGNDPELTGTISATHRPLLTQSGHEIYVLQLLVDQHLNEYKGYSGSPVVLKSSPKTVIGVLIEQVRSRFSTPIGQRPPAINVLYAIPIRDVLERFGLNGEPPPCLDDRAILKILHAYLKEQFANRDKRDTLVATVAQKCWLDKEYAGLLITRLEQNGLLIPVSGGRYELTEEAKSKIFTGGS